MIACQSDSDRVLRSQLLRPSHSRAGEFPACKVPSASNRDSGPGRRDLPAASVMYGIRRIRTTSPSLSFSCRSTFASRGLPSTSPFPFRPQTRSGLSLLPRSEYTLRLPPEYRDKLLFFRLSSLSFVSLFLLSFEFVVSSFHSGCASRFVGRISRQRHTDPRVVAFLREAFPAQARVVLHTHRYYFDSIPSDLTETIFVRSAGSRSPALRGYSLSRSRPFSRPSSFRSLPGTTSRPDLSRLSHCFCHPPFQTVNHIQHNDTNIGYYRLKVDRKIQLFSPNFLMFSAVSEKRSEKFGRTAGSTMKSGRPRGRTDTQLDVEMRSRFPRRRSAITNCRLPIA